MYSLNPASAIPLYRQIIEQTSQLIACGHLQPGEFLPSVRQVAAALGVNPMTVSRAYSLLERDGIVARRRGMGMVVAEQTIGAAEAIRPQAEALVETARRLRMSRRGVADAVDAAWQKQKRKRNE